MAGKILEAITENETADANAATVDSNDLAKLDKYVKDAKKLKEQLQKLRNWLPDSNDAGTEVEETPHKYLDFLNAKAATPISPRMLAKQLLADKVEIPSALFGNSRVDVNNLSDAPAAAKLPIEMQIKSYVTNALLKIAMDYSKGDTPEVSGTFNDFDLSKMKDGFSQQAGLQFQSGLASGSFKGTLTKEQVDLSIDVGVKNFKATGSGDGVLGLGVEETSRVMEVLNELQTTIRVVGPMTQPRLVFDTKGLTKTFQDALVAAGKQKLQDEVGKQIEKQLGDKVPTELKDTLQGKSKDLVEGIGGLLGGKKKEQEKK